MTVGTTAIRGRLVTDYEVWPGASLLVENGFIKELSREGTSPEDAELHDYGDSFLVPGFVDLQVNGCFGIDVATEPEKLPELSEKLLATGTTAYLADPDLLPGRPLRRGVAYHRRVCGWAFRLRNTRRTPRRPVYQPGEAGRAPAGFRRAAGHSNARGARGPLPGTDGYPRPGTRRRGGSDRVRGRARRGRLRGPLGCVFRDGLRGLRPAGRRCYTPVQRTRSHAPPGARGCGGGLRAPAGSLWHHRRWAPRSPGSSRSRLPDARAGPPLPHHRFHRRDRHGAGGVRPRKPQSLPGGKHGPAPGRPRREPHQR